ncbi:MAG: Mur ligase domain-containing protein, partial [Anaerolineales bacterium]
MLTISLAIEALTGERPQGNDLVIRDAVIDSRQTTPGSMFIALPGEREDGHAFVSEAFAQGATVALIDHALSEDFSHLDLRNGWNPDELLEIG